MPKIYILGSTGSGKTTLAKKLSRELNVKHYELDNVTWEYNPNGDDRKRSDEEIKLLFSNILKEDNWIIENVGKSIYDRGFDEADTIIYLNLSRLSLYKRVMYRWIRQKLKIETSSYKPSLKVLIEIFKWVDKELKNSKLNKLKSYQDKLIILNEKTIKNYKYKQIKE
jgi:adenylate kinase family enzyme